MEITTSRLRLDALRDVDAEALFAYRADPAVAVYQGWQPVHLGVARAWIARQLAQPTAEAGQWFQRAIRLRETGALIGDCGIRLPVDAGDSADIGITLAPARQGLGYAAEALGALLDWLFREKAARRVVASVDPRNLACMRLMRRLGLRQEAHFVQSVPWRGGWADDAVWALLAVEWRQNTPSAEEDRAGATR